MKVHELKTWPEYFTALRQGKKTFEVRLNDRGFEEDDVLVLREYDPQTQAYSGEFVVREVCYVMDNPEFVKPGFVVMGLCEAR